jgi:hypothetical protein
LKHQPPGVVHDVVVAARAGLQPASPWKESTEAGSARAPTERLEALPGSSCRSLVSGGGERHGELVVRAVVARVAFEDQPEEDQ